jgi:hypothetical protein
MYTSKQQYHFVLKEWVKLHCKAMKVIHDRGKEFTFTDCNNIP